MIADAVCGTHWNPGDPQPRVWSEAVKIWEDFPEVQYGQGEETDNQHPSKIKQSRDQKKLFDLIHSEKVKSQAQDESDHDSDPSSPAVEPKKSR